jgi:hypothetical protein
MRRGWVCHKIGTQCRTIILWHVDLLLGNDCKTNNKTTAIVRQQLRKYATVLELLLGSGLRSTMEVLLEAVVSMWSTPRLYHSTEFSSFQLVQSSAVEWSEWAGEWVSELVGEWVRGLLWFSPCELLLLEADSWGMGTVWKPRGRGTSDSGSHYQKTGEDTADWEDLVHAVVNWISNRAMVTCGYNMWVFNKSNYQSKTHLYSYTWQYGHDAPVFKKFFVWKSMHTQDWIL